jgi:hypothetical protein
MGERHGPNRWASDLTRVLDAIGGPARFPIDVRTLALDYSNQRYPTEAIKRVDGDNLDGCEGALVGSSKAPKTWAILYNQGQSPSRARFTIGHEFGHYLIHRHDQPGGFRCDEESVSRRNGEGLEKEADQFAAALLMPLNDFRKQIAPSDKPDLDLLSACAERYGVSLTAAILRWLEYTDRRSMIVVSREGYALWAKSSPPAFQSGRFIRTRNETFELPSNALASNGDFGAERGSPILHDPGVWFDEPVEETAIGSDTYDIAISVLHFENRVRQNRWEKDEDEPGEDMLDHITRIGYPKR